MSFKPYYKWITFNTSIKIGLNKELYEVLNLIINGLPSIQSVAKWAAIGFGVLNLIINGLPSILLIG